MSMSDNQQIKTFACRGLKCFHQGLQNHPTRQPHVARDRVTMLNITARLKQLIGCAERPSRGQGTPLKFKTLTFKTEGHV